MEAQKLGLIPGKSVLFDPAKNRRGIPAKLLGIPAKLWGIPAKLWGINRAKLWRGQPWQTVEEPIVAKSEEPRV
jgi:hypothetical protein